jgi:hypothetical protein
MKAGRHRQNEQHGDGQDGDRGLSHAAYREEGIRAETSIRSLAGILEEEGGQRSSRC